LWAGFQKVGGCAECDGMEALGCQRIMWAVHTESTNSTEIATVKGDIGQKNRSCGMRDECLLSQPVSVSRKAWRFRSPFAKAVTVVNAGICVPLGEMRASCREIVLQIYCEVLHQRAGREGMCGEVDLPGRRHYGSTAPEIPDGWLS
jgi:hypothetical protein